MNQVYIPEGYRPILDEYDTQRAIAYIKQTFQAEFSEALNLKRVSAPLFVTEESGLNDNLSGIERAVDFDIPAAGRQEAKMKKALTIMTLSALATILSAAPENPVTNLFEKDITFSINFDDGTTNADMANGKGEPAKVKKPAKFIEKGLFGKGLADGWINYDAKQNIDLTVPGTLIYWVAPTWDSKKPANGKEPGFTAVQIRGKSKEYNYTMILHYF